MKKIPCSPNKATRGMLWFPRMIDKIRLHASKELKDEYIPYLGIGFDGRCLRFMRIEYGELVKRVTEGGSDDEIFDWCMQAGRSLSDEDIMIWSDFIRKRGLRDSKEVIKNLEDSKRTSGLGHREDLDTYFRFNDADEGRDPGLMEWKA